MVWRLSVLAIGWAGHFLNLPCAGLDIAGLTWLGWTGHESIGHGLGRPGHVLFWSFAVLAMGCACHALNFPRVGWPWALQLMCSAGYWLVWQLARLADGLGWRWAALVMGCPWEGLATGWSGRGMLSANRVLNHLWAGHELD
jgi:hypothetical protein